MRLDAFFQTGLDVDFQSDALRLLFGEWLADRGDDRAVGYRFMAERSKSPYRSTETWEWWAQHSVNAATIRFPDPIWLALDVEPAPNYPSCKEWSTREAAELALCDLLVQNPSLVSTVTAEFDSSEITS